MIRVFHGFLGSPKDFSFLKSEFMNNVYFHDLYQESDFSLPKEDDVLIGYSMGGRVALDLCERVQFKIKKLILLSSHFGLDHEEKTERKIFDQLILSKLQHSNEDEFMKWWNQLSLFQHDHPIHPNHFHKSAKIFAKYQLSNQKNYLSSLMDHREKIVYIVGSKDEKYLELVYTKLRPHNFNISVIEGAGHRLFQHQNEVLKILKEHL